MKEVKKGLQGGDEREERGRKGGLVEEASGWTKRLGGWMDGWTQCSVLVIVRAWRGDRQMHR